MTFDPFSFLLAPCALPSFSQTAQFLGCIVSLTPLSPFHWFSYQLHLLSTPQLSTLEAHFLLGVLFHGPPINFLIFLKHFLVYALKLKMSKMCHTIYNSLLIKKKKILSLVSPLWLMWSASSQPSGQHPSGDFLLSTSASWFSCHCACSDSGLHGAKYSVCPQSHSGPIVYLFYFILHTAARVNVFRRHRIWALLGPKYHPDIPSPHNQAQNFICL